MSKNRPYGRTVIPEWASCKNCNYFDGKDHCSYHIAACGKMAANNQSCPDWVHLSGEDITETYIGRTKEYYEDGDWVFTPALWKWVGNPSNLAGEVHALTKEGEKLLDQWCDDVSVGYDLCHGRAKGLAAKYTSEQMWELLTDQKNGYSVKMQ